VGRDLQVGDRYVISPETQAGQGTSWDRALANAITDLETNRKLFQNAEETKRFPKGPRSNAYRPLADQLSDRAMHESREILDEAYGECSAVWTRYRELPRFEGPMADPIVPKVDESVRLPAAISILDRALDHLRSLRQDSPITPKLSFGRAQIPNYLTWQRR
jgi:hypothetical protein